MKFFETLAETGINDVVIQIKNDNKGQITVFVTPKTIAEDAALKSLQPIYLTGTPQEIDEEFFGLITTPLIETQKVFSNVESFEAQKAEIEKETSEKKAEKEKAKKVKTEIKSNDDSKGEEVAAPTKSAPKVNNEKVLRDFMTSIKGQDILIHKEKVEELYALLSEDDLAKAYAKKVRVDLDIAIRKKKNIDDARAKMGIKTELPLGEVESVSIGEEVVDIIIPALPDTREEEEEEEESTFTTKESFANKNKEEESPNVEVVGAVEVQSIPEPILEAAIEEQEMMIEGEQEDSLTIPVPTSIPLPPPAPVVPVYKEMEVFEMLVADFTREEYNLAGWSDELLLQHNKARWITTTVKVIPEAPTTPVSLGYSMPKPFDEEDNEEQEEE